MHSPTMSLSLRAPLPLHPCSVSPFRSVQLCVGGIISSGSEIIYLDDDDDRDSAASTCYYAALIYFVTFLLSVGCFVGPMFLKRKNADLEGLRKSNARRTAVARD